MSRKRLRALEHLSFLKETGRWDRLKLSDAAAKLNDLVAARAARTVLGRAAATGELERLTHAVADRTVDPYTAVDEILTRYLP